MIKGYAHRTSPAIAVVACIGVVGLAGCGGGSSSSSASTSSTSAAAAATTRASSAASSTATQSASQGAQAYALSLVPLAQTWQTAAEKYDSSVAGGGTNLSVIATASNTFASATTTFADGIAALSPPAGASGAQAALVTAVRALGSDVVELESAATDKDPAKASDAQRRVGPDGKAVSNAVLALAKAAEAG